jgi:molybdate transport system substrate-binding protein
LKSNHQDKEENNRESFPAALTHKDQRTMKRMIFIFISALLFSSPAHGQSVRISVAASMTEVVGELINNFKSPCSASEIIPNFGSSGTLAKQISQGAPVDLFISANPKWMAFLLDEEMIVPSTCRTLAHNKMVFVGAGNRDTTSLPELVGLERVAMGNPANVPAGMYARQALQGAGIYKSLTQKKKLILAKDVRQAMLYAELGEVDGAFVYLTDALLSGKIRVLFELPEELYDRVSIPIALTSSGYDKECARAFYEYMISDIAVALFAEFGFDPVL